MDTYRINRYNITDQGSKVYTNRLIQGGFRYQKLNLTSPGELQIKNIGVIPTVNVTPVAELPGSFSCSDEVLNRIWNVGARTAQLTEIIKDKIPDFWVVTEQGAYVESQAPQMYVDGQALQSYTLGFEVMPLQGGFSATVLGNTLNLGIYLFFNLENGTMTAHYGSTEVDEVIAFTMLPSQVALQTWHSVSVDVQTGGTLNVSVDGTHIMEVRQDNVTSGSFGLGAALGCSAYFRNLTAASGGKEVYSAAMTGDSTFLNDFYMGTNPRNTLLDGSRRDRIAYTGDIDMGLGNAFALKWGASFPNGSINLLGSFQTAGGFWIPTAKINQLPYNGSLPSLASGLIGNSFNFITNMAHYYNFQGDLDFAQYWVPRILKMYNWTESQSLPNGLFNVSSPGFGTDWDWFDPPQMGVISKLNAAYAYSMQEAMPLLQAAGVNTSSLQARLDLVRSSMNSVLWNDTLGAYVMSDAVQAGYAQDANAMAILSGVVAAGNRSASDLLARMQDDLFLDPGPMAFSPVVVAEGWRRTISPFTSGYHLRAAFAARDGDRAMALLRQLWAPMADPTHVNYTGAFWEELNEWGQPGIGWWTSMCHGFSAAPTAELMFNVLGVKSAQAGFKEWVVSPLTLGLRWAKGRHPTKTSSISVDWSFDDAGMLNMTVVGAQDGPGTVYFPEPLLVPLEKSVVTVDGVRLNGSEVTVQAGQSAHIVQHAA